MKQQVKENWKEAEIKEKYRKLGAEITREFQQAIGQHYLIFRRMEDLTMRDFNAKVAEMQKDMEKEIKIWP